VSNFRECVFAVWPDGPVMYVYIYRILFSLDCFSQNNLFPLFCISPISLHCSLKVPKREIFDLSDFPDFYTIKSSWVGGDLLVKILTFYFNF
jgi:hypothetical protein